MTELCGSYIHPQACELIDGVPTELVATRYANAVFIIVTQLKKMGTLVGSPNPSSFSSFLSVLSLRALASSRLDVLLYLVPFRCLSSISFTRMYKYLYPAWTLYIVAGGS